MQPEQGTLRSSVPIHRTLDPVSQHVAPNYRTLDPASKPKYVLNQTAHPPGPLFWEISLHSFLIFFVTLSAHAFLLYYHSSWVIVLTFLFGSFLVLSIVGLKKQRLQAPKRFGKFGHLVPICALGSLSLATSLGPLCYMLYGRPSTTYGAARYYTNVDAVRPAASVADAGRVVFADDAHLEVSQAAGYHIDDGNVFCVAPIVKGGPNSTRHTEFWAIGMNCCPDGSFKCGTGGSSGGGAVELDPNGLFLGGGPRERKLFDAARRKAEALWGFTKSTDALYLSWSEIGKLKTLSDDLTWKAWLFITIASVLYTFAVSVIMFKRLSPYTRGN